MAKEKGASAMTEQTICAIPTYYKGRRYRSRLEARWAAMFDLLQWHAEYEPFDCNGWIPDFAIKTYDGNLPLLVEVKPIWHLDDALKAELDRCARPEHEVLVLGLGLLPRDEHSDPDGMPLALGWLGEWPFYPDDCRKRFWDKAALGRWRGCTVLGVCSREGVFTDRISGCYDDGCHGHEHWDPAAVHRHWATACNIVQWQAVP
jgi:hypothetical protein